jgi:hypothetical protein
VFLYDPLRSSTIPIFSLLTPLSSPLLNFLLHSIRFALSSTFLSYRLLSALRIPVCSSLFACVL